MQGRADSLSFNETDGEMHLMRKPILWMGANRSPATKSGFTAILKKKSPIPSVFLETLLPSAKPTH
jgi:hypothetical protein